jgi:hypothetical protein
LTTIICLKNISNDNLCGSNYLKKRNLHGGSKKQKLANIHMNILKIGKKNVLEGF